MSQFQMPITIHQALTYVKNNNYLLPAFQREFVWKSDQIEKLFDSLMRGYPTSSMLFWKVKGDTKTKWKFYKFIDSFILGADDKSVSNELYNESNTNDFFAVLDGQQRLTAMRIGIYGSYSYHEHRKPWTYSDVSFPSRHMYLNLSREGGIDDDCKYFFEFKKDIETKLKDFYIDSGEVWFKVNKIIDFHNSGDEISDYFEDVELTKEQRRIMKRLENMIFNDPCITYYEEDEQNPDKAVKIFTRINSGGTFLAFSDIVFSLMAANWDTKDAKTEINKLFNVIGQKGFTLNKDYIVKVFLYLYHRSVKTEISSFSKDFCEVIETNWEKIKNSVISLFDLLRSFGLTSFNLTSNNATLPILYYIYHKDIYQGFTDKVGYEKERKEMKRWLFSAILRKTFGGQSDSTLQQTRKTFTEDISVRYIDNNIMFSGVDIDSNIKNITAIDDEFLNNLLMTQKDNCYAFPILSLLYPYLDYKNNNFHKDHLHAENLYKDLPEEIRKEYSFKIYNSILNLQMLDGNENESKGKKHLNQWVDEKCQGLNAYMKKEFLDSHLIPDVDLSLSNFPEFILAREKLLKNKLNNILLNEYSDEKTMLTQLLENGLNLDNIQQIFTSLRNEELLLAFNGDRLVELETDENKRYLPLFTDECQIQGKFSYTRLDKVKLDIVLKDIYSLGKYYAVAINPYTHDFIMNKELINIYTRVI